MSLFSRLRRLLVRPGQRVVLINRVAQLINATSYLEIGVRDGRTFCAIDVPVKVGVDPIPAAPRVASHLRQPTITYFQTTSDRFFSEGLAPKIALPFDIVFIDGLHTHEASLRDCLNAIRHLSQSGVIFLHDCSPANAARAYPAPSFEAARAASPPGWDGLWNGDVWKTILYLRCTLRHFGIYVIDTDHGIGVVTRLLPALPLGIDVRDIQRMTFSDLAQHRRDLLALRPPRWLYSQLRRANVCPSA